MILRLIHPQYAEQGEHSVTKKIDFIISGYNSFDHMITLKSDILVGKTSLVKNATCLKAHWGGCSVNVAVALQRLGLKAAPILRVGDDFETSGFREFLLTEGISLETISSVESDICSLSFMIQQPDGEHVTLFYPGAMDEKYAIKPPLSWFRESKAALMTVASHQDNVFFLERVKQAGIPLYFGMKGDADAFPSEFLEDVFRHSRIIFMNEAESKQICHAFNLDHISFLSGKGETEVVVITKGKNGAVYFTADGRSESVPAYKVREIVSTTGSGDAFIAGFLYALSQNMPYRLCCRCGAAVASFVLEAEACTSNLPARSKLYTRFNYHNE